MIYKWKGDSGFFGIKAQIAGEELERLRAAKNSNLIAADVVKAAKPVTSPLHKAFDWNDKSAAHSWRLSQASSLIRAVVVISENTTGQKVATRAFVNVGDGEERGYTSISVAMADDVMRAQVIARAWAELESWRERHKQLLEFSKVIEVIEDTKQQIAAKAA